MMRPKENLRAIMRFSSQDDVADDLSSVGTERTESVILTPRTSAMLCGSPPRGSSRRALPRLNSNPNGEDRRGDLTRVMSHSRRGVPRTFSDRGFAGHSATLARILNDVHYVQDVGDLVLLVSLCGDIIHEVLGMMKNKVDDEEAAMDITKATLLAEKVVNITSWSVLPELRETEEIDKDVGVQTDLVKDAGIMVIPELELDDMHSSTNNSRLGTGTVKLSAAQSPLNRSPISCSPSSRKLKPGLSPIRKLPSFTAGSFRVDNSSLYFSGASKANLKENLPKNDRLDGSTVISPGPVSRMSQKNLNTSAGAQQQPGMTPQLSFLGKKQLSFVKLNSPMDNMDDDHSKDKMAASDESNDGVNPAFEAPLHPFGETFFPDPLQEGGLARYPIDDIHKYVGIFILRCTGEVCMWNPKMVELTAIPETEACGCHISAFLLSSQDQNEVLDLMELAISTKETQQTKLSLACQDGVNRCVITLTLVSSIYPEGVYLMCYCHERVPTETKIDCILWTVQMMKKNVFSLPEGPETKKVKDDLTKLERVCGRQGTKAWGSVVIADLFGRLLTHYREEAVEVGVELCVGELDPSIPPEIQTDVKHIPQVLGYLIHNGVRFNQKGGTVTLSVDKEVIEMPDLSGDDTSKVHVIVFKIEDNGPGLPEEMLSKVDHRISEEDADPAESGQKGFGLMMTSLLVTECGGSLDIASSKDGTVAKIVIPLLMAEQTNHALDTETFEQSTCTSGIGVKALVIQPNAVTRAALCHYLWARKYAVSIASRAEEVSDFNVDVIILNIEDDQAEGKIFEKLKTVPNVELVLTAISVGNQFRDAASQNGMRVLGIPLKPQDVKRVLNEVEKALQNARDENEKIEQVRKAFRVEENTCPWERKKKIGSGAFGEVYEAVNLITKGVMAVKVIRIKNQIDGDAEALEALNEVQVMFRLQHPNIIHYFHSQLEDNEGEKQLLIFMEFASGGSLQEKLKKNGPMSVEEAAGYTTDVLQGLHYLHSNNIIHRDIKTANILIVVTPERGEVCKVTDFGTAKEVGKREGEDDDGLARSLKGTPNFMAPEVMNEQPYYSKADIWSVGCLVLELLTGKLPFSHISENPWNVIRYVCSLSTPPKEGEEEEKEQEKEEDKETPPVDFGPYTFNENTLQFLNSSVVVDPTLRLPCTELLSLPFIVHGSAELIKMYKRVSICPNSLKLRSTKLVFGDKWKDEEESRDSSDGFSGWGSDGDNDGSVNKTKKKSSMPFGEFSWKRKSESHSKGLHDKATSL